MRERVTLVPVVFTLLAMACGSSDECQDTVSLFVSADAACPAPGAVEDALDVSVDRLSGTRLTDPATVCWYRAHRRDDGCQHVYSRGEIASWETGAIGELQTYIMSCDADGMLYGIQLNEHVTSESEALAAMAKECPATVSPPEADVERFGLEVGAFVDSDFFPAKQQCLYDVHRACVGGGGGKPLWGLQ
jgi:hypothetical protein